MQLAVSAFNDDTYSRDEFLQPGLGDIEKLFPKVKKTELDLKEMGAQLNERKMALDSRNINSR